VGVLEELIKALFDRLDPKYHKEKWYRKFKKELKDIWTTYGMGDDAVDELYFIMFPEEAGE
jgi:hypothetical protein